jgi:hypothetical protein
MIADQVGSTMTEEEKQKREQLLEINYRDGLWARQS